MTEVTHPERNGPQGPLHPCGAVCPWQAAPAGPGPVASEQISRLHQQNSSLRAAVAQMRRDMEGLRTPLPPQPASSTRTPTDPGAPVQHAAAPTGSSDATGPEGAVSGTPAYTRALEQEVSELKTRCRKLEEQLEGATATTTTTTETAGLRPAPVAPENAYMQNHIRSLNETIGGLRMEKVASGAAQKKQEVRVAHLESALASLTQQFYDKQAEGEGLRLELANQKSKWASSEAGLRQRLAAVHMELEAVRREKEEYQKGHVLNQLETVALGNQVSALKLDIASRREPIVCEQSEVVGQLREENLALRRQLVSLGGLKSGSGGPKPPTRDKLKQAARDIARLTRDKQQLIAIGNRLRAQLQTSGLEERHLRYRLSPPDREVVHSVPAAERGGGAPDTHLSTLEMLQYQLTTQELQYAQREQGVVMVTGLLSESDSGRQGGQNGAANPWDQGPDDTARREGAVRGDPGSREPPSSPSGLLLSSVGTEGSLKEVWQMLDRGLSPSLLTEVEAEPERPDSPGPGGPRGPGGSGPQLALRGAKAPAKSRPGRTTSRPARSGKTGGPAAAASASGSKIRNYNIRD
ncbi:unnamed protein product [Merluccius merluccius]